VKAHAPQALLGVLLALVTIGIALLLPDGAGIVLFGVILGFVVGSYWAFASASGLPRALAIEVAAGLLFLAAAVFGVWSSPALLAAGYTAHGLWDILHHPRGVQTGIPRWVPPFCLVYDWVIAAFILWRWGL
jgi:hypothetical protein